MNQQSEGEAALKVRCGYMKESTRKGKGPEEKEKNFEQGRSWDFAKIECVKEKFLSVVGCYGRKEHWVAIS
jgi:hypothetical protein